MGQGGGFGFGLLVALGDGGHTGFDLSGICGGGTGGDGGGGGVGLVEAVVVGSEGVGLMLQLGYLAA